MSSNNLSGRSAVTLLRPRPHYLPESTILESGHDIFTTIFSAESNKTRVRFLFVDKVLLKSDYIWIVSSSCNLKDFVDDDRTRYWWHRHQYMALKSYLCTTSSHFVLFIECKTSTAFSRDIISWCICDWNRLFRIHESYLWFIINIFELK